MSDTHQLTPKQFAALVTHLFQEGERAYEAQQDQEAVTWFSQCLMVVRQIGNQEDWMGALFFNLGKVMAHSGYPRQALAFLEASANVQFALPQGEPEGDMYQGVGILISKIGFPAQARFYLERALELYRELSLDGKMKEARQALDDLAPEAQTQPAPSLPRTLHFEIRRVQEVESRLTITAGGKIEWKVGEGLARPVVLGSREPWLTSCTNA